MAQTIAGYTIGVLVIGIVVALLWLDHVSARRHDEQMADIRRRTKDWEELLSACRKGKR